MYIVVAPDPSRSLTIHVEGVQDNQSGTAVLDGRVVDGQLTGARAHAEYKVISGTQSSGGTCFQGTISIKRGSRATEKARRRARLITVQQPIYTSERRRSIKLLVTGTTRQMAPAHPKVARLRSREAAHSEPSQQGKTEPGPCAPPCP